MSTYAIILFFFINTPWLCLISQKSRMCPNLKQDICPSILVWVIFTFNSHDTSVHGTQTTHTNNTDILRCSASWTWFIKKIFKICITSFFHYIVIYLFLNRNFLGIQTRVLKAKKCSFTSFLLPEVKYRFYLLNYCSFSSISLHFTLVSSSHHRMNIG